MAIDQELVDAAVNLVEARLPQVEWAGGAAMRLHDGTIVTSLAPKARNPAVETCHETGALCEAYKLDKNVVASVCVIRSSPSGDFWILTPCGVCQERLFSYGPAVEVAVPEADDPRKWRSLRLDEVQPHWWSKVFTAKETGA
jgi:cytidine deaminase